MLKALGLPSGENEEQMVYRRLISSAIQVSGKSASWKCLCQDTPNCEDKTIASRLQRHCTENADILANRAHAFTTQQLAWSLICGGPGDDIMSRVLSSKKLGFEPSKDRTAEGAAAALKDYCIAQQMQVKSLLVGNASTYPESI